MNEVEEALLLGLREEFAAWVDMLSFREIYSNEEMVQAIEYFERLLRIPNII